MLPQFNLNKEPIFRGPLPPISHLKLQPTHQASRPSYQWHDPFFPSRAYNAPSVHSGADQKIINSHPVQQMQSNTGQAISTALFSYRGTSDVERAVPPLDSNYEAIFLSRWCSNEPPLVGKYSIGSTDTSAKHDKWDGGIRGSDDESGRQGDTNGRSKRKKHALSEKDRREIMNFHIRKLKSLTFPEYYVDVTSVTPHNKDEAKNEILRYSVAFMMALVHRLAVETSSNAMLRQENSALREEKLALTEELANVREGWGNQPTHTRYDRQYDSVTKDGASTMESRRMPSNQSRSFTMPFPEIGTHRSEGACDYSLVSSYKRSFETPPYSLWLENVMESTIDIASKRQDEMKRIIKDAKDRCIALTKDVLEKSLD